ncbi:hypothetical protein EKO04_007890 [Ascochyta lentis]|uniref:Ubiquitin-like protease family profile domain-containing protein n=1 Tax=Ascochyta lentis TaxID=205686 RepID=A0A8H7J216_9PLEO|nr:hypothetical protein EKO04_007890 [Ascochyta lentis]
MTTNEAGTSTSRQTIPASSTGPPTLTEPEIVDQWLNKTYTRYNLEDRTESIVSIQEFLNIVRTNYPECYLPESTLVLSLALSAKKWDRSNTVIISDQNAQRLYHLGVGADTREEVLTLCPELQPTLLNRDKRWILIPCSDGILEAANVGKGFKNSALEDNEPTVPSSGTASSRPPGNEETESTESQKIGPQKKNQSGGHEKKRKQKKRQPKGPEKHGNHWGLLVIDKTEKVARWVDSAITLVQRSDKPTKLKFGNMYSAAVVAGKVLCGIDALLGEENGFSEGGFTTSTLKYVPQQGSNNSYSGQDGGPCGPFAFAFVEHIFERATTLDSVGVRKMFPRSMRGKLKFNSMDARREMRRLIQQESEEPKELPFKLSSDLISILKVVPVEHLQKSVDAYRRKLAAPNPPPIKPSQPPHGFEQDPNLLAAFEQDKFDNPALYEGLGNTEAMETFISIQKANLNSHGKGKDKKGAKGSASGGQGSKNTTKGLNTDIYLGRQLYQNIPLNDATIWPPHDKDSIYWPRKVKELPDFAKLDEKGLIGWRRKSPEVQEHEKKNKKHSSVTSCAMLHVKFKKTFLGESDDNFKAVWSKDETLFDPKDPKLVAIDALQNDSLKYGQMRLMMMQHYEADTLPGLLANLAKYKPSVPPSGGNNNKDDDDDDDNDDDNNNGEPKMTKTTNRGQSNSGLGGNETGPNGPTDIDISSNPNGWDMPTPKPLGLLDFRTMPESELVEYQMPEQLADARLHERNVNTVSWRAFLFVTIQNGGFGEESDYDCINLWLEDTVVFSNEDRESDWTELTGLIRSRMEAHYCVDTQPSPSLGLSDDDPMEEDSDLSLSPVPSNLSNTSDQGSDDSNTAPTKRKRDVEDGSSKDASVNKRRKHNIPESGGQTNASIDSTGEFAEQASNDSGTESAKDKRPARDAQRQQALRALRALQDAAESIQGAADGLKRLVFPNPAVSTPRATGDDDDSSRFSKAYRGTRATPSSARPSSVAGGDDYGSESESSGSSDPPTSDSEDTSGSSSLPDSEDSNSEDSDSEDYTDEADSSKKRRRDSEENDRESDTDTSKKPKTSHSPSSGESGEASDPNSSNLEDFPPVHSDGSDDETVADDPASDPQVNSSFGSEETVEDSTIEIYIGREPYILNLDDTSLFLPWDHTEQDWPIDVIKLPDFAHMDASDFTLWYKFSPELKTKVGIHIDKANLVTYRAALHMKFKKTFLHENDRNFSDVWVNDTTVFSATTIMELQAIKDPMLRNGEIRRRMMEFYEPTMLQKLQDLPKPIPRLTVQAASFEDPESFKSDTSFVEVSRKPGVPTDPSLLLPKATATTESNVRSKYGLRPRPKPSMKKRDG